MNKEIKSTENLAIGYINGKLEERKLSLPELAAGDVLVKVFAASVNPVDLKMAASLNDGKFHILGFDGVGEILQVGNQVKDFKIGDRIFYSGQQWRAGSNQRFQVIDAQLIAKAPANLTNAEAAALPLTALTAAEILVDHFGLKLKSNSAEGKSIFIINGAGGVGSMLIQLAKFLGMNVTTTASRSETVAWVKQLGSDRVLNHHENLESQLSGEKFDYIAILYSTDQYWSLVLQHIAPFGKINSIVETTAAINMGPLKNIGAQFSWEFMFAKANFDVRTAEQGELLAEIAELIEKGILHSSLTKTYQGFNLANLEKASQDVATGKMIGKVAIEY